MYSYYVKTTILVEGETRRRLKQIGKKSQTYDQLINELIESKLGKTKTEDLLNVGFEIYSPSESKAHGK